MKISVNSIRGLNSRYRCAEDIAPDGVAALAQRIGAQLGAVEEVTPFGFKYEGVLVAKVVSVMDHPDADRLHICKVDDGGKAEGVERDDNGYVQVVCGAPNVREGLIVAWLPPGSTVPDTVGKDPFILEARPLRGVVSQGMLASPRELAIGDSHDGIIELDTDAAPGTTFIEAYDLQDDQIIDIENKMFTHRPDCFGFLGVARELAGIQHLPFRSPDWYKMDAELPGPEVQELKLEVRNELPELVPRFTAITMRDVKIGPSPIWCQLELAKAGIRPINNIVDYTNFFMLKTGQPLHAYDYDKVVTQDADAGHAAIVVRKPHEGEKVTLLNGKEITPRAEAIMIATRDKLIGVGGVMGGGDTEVDEHTTNIILECASFDMYSVRRTSMAHGLFTDAVTRFNKGQSPLQNRAVLAKIVDEIRRFAHGKVAGALVDDNHIAAAALERQSVHPPVQMSAQFINDRLGLQLSADQMTMLLTNVEFRVDAKDDDLIVTAPFWRTDIEIPEDIVEEIGRLHGFDRLPLELPKRDLTPVKKNPMLELKSIIRDCLSRAGANEVLTYSFVHGNLLDKAEQSRDTAFQLSNALSPDLQYFRLDVIPSLLDKIHPNIKAGYDAFAIFELGKNHTLLHKNDEEGLPREFDMVALAYAANDKAAQPGAAFYQARTFLTQLADALNIELQFSPVTDAPDVPIVKPYDLSRSAFVTVRGTDHFLGIVGEFKASVRRNLKLPVHTAGFEVGVKELLEAPRNISTYIALPRFPKVEQDICLKVPAPTTYEQVYDFVWSKITEVQPVNTLPGLGPVDIYQRADDPGHKQITLRFSLASYDRTLTDNEVSKILDHAAEAAKTGLAAERI